MLSSAKCNGLIQLVGLLGIVDPSCLDDYIGIVGPKDRVGLIGHNGLVVLIGSSTLMNCWISDLVGHSDLSGISSLVDQISLGFVGLVELISHIKLNDLSLISLIGLIGLVGHIGFVDQNDLVGNNGLLAASSFSSSAN